MQRSSELRTESTGLVTDQEKEFNFKFRSVVFRCPCLGSDAKKSDSWKRRVGYRKSERIVSAQ
jgi:hypothetical protein